MKKNKKQKLKELLDQVNALGKLSIEENENLTDSLIKQEMSSAAERIKENTTIRAIDKLSKDIATFKKTFTVEPVLNSIKELSEELSTSEQNTIEYVNSQIKGIKVQLDKMRVPKDATDDIRAILASISDLENKITELPIYDSQIKNLESEYDTLGERVGVVEKEHTTIYSKINDNLELIDKIEKRFNVSRIELLARINEHGGGNMNRQIRVGGTNVLTKYTDINWVAGTGITLSAANDDTNDRVNITISSTADLSVTLADVSANSTTTAQSLYTMTAGVPVEFRSSDGNPLLYLDETNERISIGSNNVTLAKVFISGGTIPTGTEALRVIGTLPNTGDNQGIVFDITSSGTAVAQTAFQALLNAGYSGSSITVGIETINAAASTGNDLKWTATFNNILGNAGINAFTSGTTTGLNVAGKYEALNGNLNIAVYGVARAAKNSAVNIAGVFNGRNTGSSSTQVGVWATLAGVLPTWESAALVADNGDQAVPIALFKDNGTTVASIANGGNFDAVSYSVGGTAGFNGTGAYTTLTIVNGIITNAV